MAHVWRASLRRGHHCAEHLALLMARPYVGSMSDNEKPVHVLRAEHLIADLRAHMIASPLAVMDTIVVIDAIQFIIGADHVAASRETIDSRYKALAACLRGGGRLTALTISFTATTEPR